MHPWGGGGGAYLWEARVGRLSPCSRGPLAFLTAPAYSTRRKGGEEGGRGLVVHSARQGMGIVSHLQDPPPPPRDVLERPYTVGGGGGVTPPSSPSNI